MADHHPRPGRPQEYDDLVQFKIERDMKHALREVASDRGTNISAVVRTAVRKYLVTCHQPEIQEPSMRRPSSVQSSSTM